MRQRTLNTLAFTLASFSVVSGFFQVLALSPLSRELTFVLTVVLGSGAFVFFRKAQAHGNAIGALKGLFAGLPRDDTYSVRGVANDGELKELWEIDNESYEEASISFELFRSWWRKYPKGLQALFHGDTVIGAIGIWPLQSKPCCELMEGKRREREITPRCMAGAKSGARRHWYISGVVLKKRLRKTRAIRVLLVGTLTNWLEDIRAENSVTVCALAYSKDGEALLRRFGFRRYKDAGETLDHYPIFVHQSLSARGLRTILRRLVPPGADVGGPSRIRRHQRSL